MCKKNIVDTLSVILLINDVCFNEQLLMLLIFCQEMCYIVLIQNYQSF